MHISQKKSYDFSFSLCTCWFNLLKVTSLLRQWWISWGIRKVASTWRACSWRQEVWFLWYPQILTSQGFTTLQQLQTLKGAALDPASDVIASFTLILMTAVYSDLICLSFVLQVYIQTLHLCEIHWRRLERHSFSQLWFRWPCKEEAPFPEQTWPQTQFVFQAWGGGCHHWQLQGLMI